MSGKKHDLGVTPQGEDFSEWFNKLVVKAGVVDHGLARGTMIIMPYGQAIWELIQAELDRGIKATGHLNVTMPSLIPESFLKREAEHVEGFSPELAVITHAGGKELEEALVVRPTSETLFAHFMRTQIQSHRDLPQLLNQWANVVRWELRPRLLLRTTEFLWQEGHTAHASEQEAMEETTRILTLYSDFARNFGAIPMVSGEKTVKERFAGAVRTLTIEGMMQDGKALQSGTSHYLGQNFARAFDIQYASASNEQEYVHTTSWGMSTRILGGIVMAHGDDKGLVLPPRLAPFQVVIVPIGRVDKNQNVHDAARALAEKLQSNGIRVKIDGRDNVSAGFKSKDWELKGVPVQLTIGERDLAAGVVTLSYRVGVTEKQTVGIDQIAGEMQDRLDGYHDVLLARATSFQKEHIATTNKWTDFDQAVQTGWALAFHCGSAACEDDIKEHSGASSRCIPTEAVAETGTCVRCGNKSAYGQRIYFARAY